MAQEGIALIGVWVSLGSLEAIREHVRANLQDELKVDTVQDEVSAAMILQIMLWSLFTSPAVRWALQSQSRAYCLKTRNCMPIFKTFSCDSDNVQCDG